jgi:hypothetical protein
MPPYGSPRLAADESMIPKKPVTDAIRDGTRFSNKIVLKRKIWNPIRFNEFDQGQELGSSKCVAS